MGEKYKVLLVDDDKLIRYVTTVYFKRIGFALDKESGNSCHYCKLGKRRMYRERNE